MLKELKTKTVQKGKKIVTRDILEKHRAHRNGLKEAAISAYKGRSLKTSLQIKYLVTLKALINYRYKAPIKQLHGYRALTK